MAVQERVSVLEGRVGELSHVFEGVQGQIRGLEERVDRRLEAFQTQITGFEERVDRRFEAIDARFASIDLRLDGIDRRFDGVDRRLGGIDAKMSRQFMWLVGLVVTMFAATMTAVLGALLTR